MLVKVLAFDLGASGVKVVLAGFDGEKMDFEIVDRFPTYNHEKDGFGWWDFESIFDRISKNIEMCADKYSISSLGIDSWGVDFGLLDNNGKLIHDPLQYWTMLKKDTLIEKDIEENKDWINHRAPTQFKPFNTVYQLILYKKIFPKLLEQAKTILSIPSLIAQRLVGISKYEFTHATTTQIFNYESGTWDQEIIKRLKFPDIFPEVVSSGTVLGQLKKKISVVLPATHDTASAFASVTSDDKNTMIISLGTWCLNGMIVEKLSKREELIKRNFAIEGCADGRLRVISNTSGLWFIQSLRKLWLNKGKTMDYSQMTNLAKKAQPFKGMIDVDNPFFQKSLDLDKAIAKESTRMTGNELLTEGEIIRTILEGIVLKIRYTKEELEKIFETTFRKIHVIGGGVRNKLLCQMISDATGLPLFAGPIEGTSAGNAIVQLKTLGYFKTIEEGKTILSNSFDVKRYLPNHSKKWDEHYNRFKEAFLLKS